MPRTTPTVKVMQTESVGGKVVLEGETFDDAYAHARKLEQELGLTFVHPFDDPAVAAGQGTVALEMLEDQGDLDCLVTPIGGGGLISGMAVPAVAIKPQHAVVGEDGNRGVRGERVHVPVKPGGGTIIKQKTTNEI